MHCSGGKSIPKEYFSEVSNVRRLLEDSLLLERHRESNKASSPHQIERYLSGSYVIICGISERLALGLGVFPL